MGLLPPEVTSPLVAGRLGMFIDTWKVLTSNLSSQSIQNPFVSLPSQDTIPTKPVFPPEQAVQVREEIRLLLEKGAIAPVTDSQGGFYSKLFLVPKNGQMRPVINLKWLN